MNAEMDEKVSDLKRNVDLHATQIAYLYGDYAELRNKIEDLRGKYEDCKRNYFGLLVIAVSVLAMALYIMVKDRL